MDAPHGTPAVVDLADKLSRFEDLWNPRLVGRVNGQELRLAWVEGAFVPHSHAEGDELFLVVSGRLELHLDDAVLTLEPGQLCVVPRGVRHQPVAPVRTALLMLDPAGTVTTGDVDDPRRRDTLEEL